MSWIIHICRIYIFVKLPIVFLVKLFAMEMEQIPLINGNMEENVMDNSYSPFKYFLCNCECCKYMEYIPNIIASQYLEEYDDVKDPYEFSSV
jgi:hypothetical protein